MCFVVLNPFRCKRSFKNFGQNWDLKIGQKSSIRGSPKFLTTQWIIPKMITSAEISIGDPQIEVFWPIFGSQFWPKFSNGRSWRKGLRYVCKNVTTKYLSTDSGDCGRNFGDHRKATKRWQKISIFKFKKWMKKSKELPNKLDPGRNNKKTLKKFLHPTHLREEKKSQNFSRAASLSAALSSGR